MTITYESAHKRFCDARKEYFRLEYDLAAARAKMAAAERDCLVEWRKVVLAAEQRASAVPSDQHS